MRIDAVGRSIFAKRHCGFDACCKDGADRSKAGAGYDDRPNKATRRMVCHGNLLVLPNNNSRFGHRTVTEFTDAAANINQMRS